MQYAVRMNIAESRAFGALRIVVLKRELERETILNQVAEMTMGER